MLVSTGQVTVSLDTPIQTVPGLSGQITVLSNSFVVFSSDGGIMTNGAHPGDFVQVEFHLVVDDVILAKYQVAVENGNFLTSGRWSFSMVAPLSAATHSVRIDVQLFAIHQLPGNPPPAAFVAGLANSANHATLTAIVLNK
jgi:hypothetical protein